jgi:hypothetical protein
MAVVCLVISWKMVDLKGGGPIGNGASRANRFFNNFSLSDYDDGVGCGA